MNGSKPDGLWSIVTVQRENIRLARCNGLFRLTLTLSLGEREQRAARSRKPTIVDYAPGRERFTLSPRERAGVRGSGAAYRPVYRIAPGTVKLGESSGRAGGFPKRF